MGAVSITTSEEMDLFLVEKQIELIKKGIKIKGKNHVVIHLIKEAMEKQATTG